MDKIKEKFQKIDFVLEDDIPLSLKKESEKQDDQ